MKKLWLMLLLSQFAWGAYSPSVFVADPTTPTNQAKVQSATPANTDKALTVILQPNSSSIATTVADGSSVTIGAKGDAAATDSTSSWSLISISKGLWSKLGTINTTLGSPFQAGGSIGNTSFGISGTLPAFTAIPSFKIDQTTPGTTNGVQVNAALPAGTNNIGKVQDLAPLNSTGSGSAAAATVSTVITLTAPANAVGAFLMNIDTSTANIRWAVNRTATTTLGQQLQPGRDAWIPTSHDISLVAESGTQTYDVQWISQ